MYGTTYYREGSHLFIDNGTPNDGIDVYLRCTSESRVRDLVWHSMNGQGYEQHTLRDGFSRELVIVDPGPTDDGTFVCRTQRGNDTSGQVSITFSSECTFLDSRVFPRTCNEASILAITGA